MADRKGVPVRLSKQERHEINRMLSGGLQPVRTVLRALALRQLAAGQTIRKVAASVGLTPKTVWLTSQRYQQGGLERALYERARPGAAALLDAPLLHAGCSENTYRLIVSGGVDSELSLMSTEKPRRLRHRK